MKRLILINKSTLHKLQLSLIPTFLENICKCATYFTKFDIWAPSLVWPGHLRKFELVDLRDCDVTQTKETFT